MAIESMRHAVIAAAQNATTRGPSMRASAVRRHLEYLGISCRRVTTHPGLVSIIAINDALHVCVYSDGWMRLGQWVAPGRFRFAPATRSIDVLAWQIFQRHSARARGAPIIAAIPPAGRSALTICGRRRYSKHIA